MQDITCDIVEKGDLKLHILTSSPAGLVAKAVLIEASRELVLIDCFMTVADAAELVTHIQSVGKPLRSVYITHAHPDHYGGLPAIHAAFPGAELLARQPVLDGLTEWPAKKLHWMDIYGDQLPQDMVMPGLLTGDHTEVEGRTLRFLDLPPAETVHATAFDLPDLKTFIAGDLLFNRSHLYMADTNNPVAWKKAIKDSGADVAYDLIIPGHGDAGGDEIITRTVEWLDYYESIAVPGVRFQEIAPKVYERFPGYALPLILWVTRGPGFGLCGASEAGVPPEVLGG